VACANEGDAFLNLLVTGFRVLEQRYFAIVARYLYYDFESDQLHFFDFELENVIIDFKCQAHFEPSVFLQKLHLFLELLF
jgi:hypothetical protein